MSAVVTAIVGHLCIDQRPRLLEILLADRLRRPEGERADRAGRVVAGILREGRRAHYEQVRHIPALEIAVERARLRVRAHDRAAIEMRGLVLGNVVRPLARLLLHDLAPIALTISA